MGHETKLSWRLSRKRVNCPTTDFCLDGGFVAADVRIGGMGMLTRVTLAALVIVAALSCFASDVGAQTRLPPGSIPPPSAPAVIPLDTIQDGSFESTLPPNDNPFWGETSTNFGTPLCTVAFCGNGGGTTAPRTGRVWAWFGGALLPDLATVSQNVILAPGKTILTFHLWNGETGNSADYLRVLVDGTQVFQVFAGDGRFTGGYTPVTLDLAAFADGGVHLLTIEGAQTTSAVTNISVDDISLRVSVQAPVLGRTGLGLALLILLAAAGRAFARRNPSAQ